MFECTLFLFRVSFAYFGGARRESYKRIKCNLSRFCNNVFTEKKNCLFTPCLCVSVQALFSTFSMRSIQLRVLIAGHEEMNGGAKRPTFVERFIIKPSCIALDIHIKAKTKSDLSENIQKYIYI